MKKLSFVLIMIFVSEGFSQDLNSFFGGVNTFFKNHVLNGKVDYANIHSNRDGLNEILQTASVVSVSIDNVEAYQAFWVNAYNISVIKGIIDNYPTKSPLDNAGFFDKTIYNLAGMKITLNDIENKLLRAQFKDARFHFVLVCGAIGCPPLISEAYLPEILFTQMETQTKKALNGSFVRVNTKKKCVEVSQIMEWYKEDFNIDGKTEIDFINKYRSEKIPNNFKLMYFPYDWNVNNQFN